MNNYLSRFVFILTVGLFGLAIAGLAGCAMGGGRSQASSSGTFRLFLAPQTLRSDEVTLLWEKPQNAIAGMTYQVLRDNQPLAKTTRTNFTAKGLAPERHYVFSVVAQTGTGVDTARSNVLAVETRSIERVISIEEFGAKGDGQTKNTRAIQAAIDACPPNGIVLIPHGIFVSGALFLKSDTTLQIAADGVLKGSTVPEDYEPFILNRFEGWELKTYASLINAGHLDHNGPANVRNVSIRGEGKIAGGGAPLAKAMIAAHGLRSRGRLICLMNCSGIEVQGLTLEDSPCWTLHYIYSEDVSCHDLTINSSVRNGDGLDPDSSKNSYIFNCAFANGDDCIAIKSGKNPEGNIVNRPTENVRITDCLFREGHGISIGSEISGGVRDVLVQDCVAGKLLYGLQIKATKDRGNVVEGVTVRDCDLQKISILTALNYNNDGKPAPEPPYFRNFRFVNIDLTKATPATPVVLVNGYSAAGHRTKNVTFENMKLPAGAIVTVDKAEDVTFSNVVTTDGQKPIYKVTESDRVSY